MRKLDHAFYWHKHSTYLDKGCQGQYTSLHHSLCSDCANREGGREREREKREREREKEGGGRIEGKESERQRKRRERVDILYIISCDLL